MNGLVGLVLSSLCIAQIIHSKIFDHAMALSLPLPKNKNECLWVHEIFVHDTSSKLLHGWLKINTKLNCSIMQQPELFSCKSSHVDLIIFKLNFPSTSVIWHRHHRLTKPSHHVTTVNSNKVKLCEAEKKLCCEALKVNDKHDKRKKTFLLSNFKLFTLRLWHTVHVHSNIKYIYSLT
mgnify:CR=1 FL=1